MRIPGLAKPKLEAIFLLIDITSYIHICQRIGEVGADSKSCPTLVLTSYLFIPCFEIV